MAVSACALKDIPLGSRLVSGDERSDVSCPGVLSLKERRLYTADLASGRAHLKMPGEIHLLPTNAKQRTHTHTHTHIDLLTLNHVLTPVLKPYQTWE